jgi:hypothetical protein
MVISAQFILMPTAKKTARDSCTADSESVPLPGTDGFVPMAMLPGDGVLGD